MYLDARAGPKVATHHVLPPRRPPILAPSCPSGGIGRRSGLRPSQLSPRGEIPWVKPVKVGRGPEASRFELMPSQAPESPGKVWKQDGGHLRPQAYGEGVLNPTNPAAHRLGRRKPQRDENPPPLKACRFDSDLGHHTSLRRLSPPTGFLPGSSRCAASSLLRGNWAAGLLVRLIQVHAAI